MYGMTGLGPETVNVPTWSWKRDEICLSLSAVERDRDNELWEPPIQLLSPGEGNRPSARLFPFVCAVRTLALVPTGRMGVVLSGTATIREALTLPSHENSPTPAGRAEIFCASHVRFGGLVSRPLWNFPHIYVVTSSKFHRHPRASEFEAGVQSSRITGRSSLLGKLKYIRVSVKVCPLFLSMTVTGTANFAQKLVPAELGIPTLESFCIPIHKLFHGRSNIRPRK